MASQHARYLLTPDTLVTCPKCEHEFPLAEGFAKKALESVEEASSDALAKLREEEREATERQAAMIARERDAAHEKALAQVRALAERELSSHSSTHYGYSSPSVIPRLAAVDKREAAVAAREKSLETRVAELAATRAAELVAGERQGYEKRLAERDQQLQALRAEQVSLREERQRLQDEKAAMALEVQRQVDARTAGRETLVRAQEQERAGLEKAELQKKIDDMAGKLAEAQAKASQGSQQLQGEVLELAIEEALKRGVSAGYH